MAKSFPNTGATVIDTVADLPGSPSEGMMVFQKDTNELKIYDGSSWISMLDTDTPPALVHIATNTLSNNSGTTFDSVFTTIYDYYRIVGHVYSNSSTGILAVFRTSGVDNASTTFRTTGTYQSFATGTQANVTFLLNSANIFFGQTDAANADSSFSHDIFNPKLTTQTLVQGQAIANHGTNAAGQSFTFYSANTSTTAFDGIRIFNPTGIGMHGKISVYGYRNSI